MRALLALALALTLAACAGPFDALRYSVKVVSAAGHGSGTAVGSGLILTAAHVVKDGETVTLIRSDGSELKAVTVWRAPAEDVAILRITDGTMPEARMSCALPKPGEPIEIVGNPGPLTFITLRGFVASSVNVRGPWRVAHILDATAMGGVSGGGVFDTRGRLIGILVGAYASGISPQSGISVMVPASEICLMMGRT